MANISAIKLPSNITYDLKDKNALEKEYTEVVYADERDSGSISWTSTPDGATLQGQTSGGYWSITPSGFWAGYHSSSTIQLRINGDGFRFDKGNYSVTIPPDVSGRLTVGSGTSGYLTKWNGTNSLTNGPQLGSSTTTFLRNDGSWAAPVGTTYSVVSKTANGLAPQLPNETTTTKFLRQDGSWAVPSYTVNTDTKVNMIQRGTTKAYLLGSTTAPTASAQAVTSVAETGVYLETSNSATRLIAPTFVGALTGTASGNLTSNSTLSAAKLSGAIPSAVTATTQTAGNNSTKIATTAYVDSAISGLPTPMQFIGTVGTNGTTTWANLPAASGHNGYTYKVITAHTAETGKPAADVGDALISNGTEWIVIPAGDETATQSATTGISIANHGTGTVIGVQSTTTSVTGVSGSVTGSHVKSGGNGTAPTLGGKIPTVSASDVTVPIKNTSATTVPIKNASATSIPNVTSVGSASTWAFTSKTVVTDITFAMDTTDTKKLKITKSTDTVYSKSSGANGTAPTLGTAISIIGVQSSTTSVTGVQSSTTTASKVTVGTSNTDYAVTSAGSASNWVFEDVTVPKAAATATTVPIKNSSASTFVTGTTHTITDNGHTHTI